MRGKVDIWKNFLDRGRSTAVDETELLIVGFSILFSRFEVQLSGRKLACGLPQPACEKPKRTAVNRIKTGKAEPLGDALRLLAGVLPHDGRPMIIASESAFSLNCPFQHRDYNHLDFTRDITNFFLFDQSTCSFPSRFHLQNLPDPTSEAQRRCFQDGETLHGYATYGEVSPDLFRAEVSAAAGVVAEKVRQNCVKANVSADWPPRAMGEVRKLLRCKAAVRSGPFRGRNYRFGRRDGGGQETGR